ncbi:MAG: DNA-protecting protein DprA [Gemmatimonadales bacterium]|nr:MAG: DNA-protecting protein DprA [Gemmatimonadales bacterium]
MVGRGGSGTLTPRAPTRLPAPRWVVREPGASWDQEQLTFLLALRATEGVGDRSVSLLLGKLSDPEEVWRCPAEDWRRITDRARPAGVGRAQGLRDAQDLLRWCRRQGIQVTGMGLPGYPPALRQLHDPPPVLFFLGRTDLLERDAVAVVGTRRASAPGRRFSENLGRELSSVGVPIVSGLALGIDAAAHRGALQGPGGTIAVLGTGVDRVHPPSHRRLQRAVVDGGGLLVSEFLPGEAARSHHFPRRNRILAALARAVVVVEAGRRSGAFITVDHALDLGLDIYAVPGPVEWEQCRGTNELLLDGAWLLTHPREILECSNIRTSPGPGRGGSDDDRGDGQDAEAAADGVAADSARILDALARQPQLSGLLADDLGVPVARVLEILSDLELDGSVSRGTDGWRLAHPPAHTSSGAADGGKGGDGGGRVRRTGFRPRPRPHPPDSAP